MAAPESTLLEVDAGGDRGGRCLLVFSPAGTRVIPLPERGTLVLGRALDADVVLDDERVSRRHTEITVDGERITAHDLGSRNGTHLAGARIAGPTPLDPGAELRIGSTVLLVRAAASPRPQRLIPHTEFEARLGATVRRARAEGLPLALVLIRTRAPAEALLAALPRPAGRARPIGDYGGGDFALLLQDPAEATSGALAAALREGGVAATIGIALYPRDATSAEALVAAARAALAEVRPAGGGDYVAEDPSTRAMFSLVRKLAAGRIPVLVMGETGCGKEIVAEALHTWSPRAGGPLVRVNCASLPEQLLEAELFGHERGAFTGAAQAKPGLFEAAGGGTLFLDEIGDLPASQQAKLLRALEDGTIRRVGSVHDHKVDVRVVAATNRDLEQASSRGDFRADLYFRLSGATVVVPPLRARQRDILPLAHRFIADLDLPVTLSPEAEQPLVRYAWPGNVRELRNAVERAALLCEGGVIAREHLPERVLAAPSAEPGETGYRAVKNEMRTLERGRIMEALEACCGNQTAAAERLGMSRRTLVAKMTALAIPRRRQLRPSSRST